MQVILDVCGLRGLTVERLKPKSKTSSASCGQRSRHFLGKDDLERFTDLRVYYPRPADIGRIRESIHAAFPATRRVEFLRAELCRKELLIEIEGVARCDAVTGAIE